MRSSFATLIALVSLLVPCLSQETLHTFVDPGKEAHSRYLTGIFFRNQASEAITVSWDGTVKIWDLASGKLLKTLRDPERDKSSFTNSIYLASKNQLVVRNGQEILHFDLDSSELVNRIQPDTPITGLAGSGDFLYIVTDGGVLKLNLQGEVVNQFRQSRLDGTIVARGGRVAVKKYHGEILILDANELTLEKSLTEKGANGFALSPNGKSLAFTDYEKFEVVNLDTGRVLHSATPQLVDEHDTPRNFKPHWTNNGLYWARATGQISMTPFLFQGAKPEPISVDFTDLVLVLDVTRDGQSLFGFYYGAFAHRYSTNGYQYFKGEHFPKLKSGLQLSH